MFAPIRSHTGGDKESWVSHGMIVGTGIDIVEIERVRKLGKRYGERFLERVFTPDELARCQLRRNPWPGLAARFAAKEAAMKALGVGLGAVGWRDLEVSSQRSGAPTLLLRSRAAERARELRIDQTYVSLSHSHSYAVAQVICVGEVDAGIS